MKLYVITLYRANMSEHYVGVVKTKPTKDQLETLAKRFNLSNKSDEEDEIGVTEIDLTKNLDSLHNVFNIYKDSYLSGSDPKLKSKRN